MKVKEISIPIYKHRVVLIAGDLNTVASYLNSLYTENLKSLDLDWDSAAALCFVIKGDIYVWWENRVTIPVLGHEILHATYEIMKQRGISLHDQEAFCYLWQYIMEQALNTLRHIPTAPSNPVSDVGDTQA